MADQNSNSDHFLSLIPVHGNMALTEGAYISQQAQQEQSRQQRISSGRVQGNMSVVDGASIEKQSQFNTHGISSTGRAQGNMAVIDDAFISQQQARQLKIVSNRLREREMNALSSGLSSISISSPISTPLASDLNKSMTMTDEEQKDLAALTATSDPNQGMTMTVEECKDLTALTAMFSETVLQVMCITHRCSRVSAALKWARLVVCEERTMRPGGLV